MKVPLAVNDFIDRAELLYPDRVGIVDEPDQPAESWGSLTYRRGRRAGPGDGRRPRRRSASASASGWRWSATTRPG